MQSKIHSNEALMPYTHSPTHIHTHTVISLTTTGLHLNEWMRIDVRMHVVCHNENKCVWVCRWVNKQVHSLTP